MPLPVLYWFTLVLVLATASLSIYTVLQSERPDKGTHWLGWVLWYYGAALLILGVLFGVVMLALVVTLALAVRLLL